MTVNYQVLQGDVLDTPSDLLILKHAQDFYGADAAIATALTDGGICTRNNLRVEPGRHLILETRGIIAPARVMIVGVPPLREFRYKQMREFTRYTIERLSSLPTPIHSLTTTVHGAGYGLDIEESLQSMVFGFQLGLSQNPLPTLKKITFVEQNHRRSGTLEASLRAMGALHPTPAAAPTPTFTPSAKPAAAPALPPIIEKEKVFVAMPFSRGFEDVYDFGILATVRGCGYVCEKVDESSFAGDIVARIHDEIRTAKFVIADLTDDRPNVYLEVGLAWGLNKPVILVAREGQKLHFDLSHHKCLFYPTIGHLARELDRHIRNLFQNNKPVQDNR
jgi:hypothetical protein